MRSENLFWRSECVSLRLCSKKSLHSFLLDKCEFYTSLRHKHSHTTHTTILQKQTIAHACTNFSKSKSPMRLQCQSLNAKPQVESWKRTKQLVCRSEFLLIRRKTQKIKTVTPWIIQKKWKQRRLYTSSYKTQSEKAEMLVIQLSAEVSAPSTFLKKCKLFSFSFS